MSFEEYKEAFLRDHDEIMILEVLEINGEELIGSIRGQTA